MPFNGGCSPQFWTNLPAKKERAGPTRRTGLVPTSLDQVRTGSKMRTFYHLGKGLRAIVAYLESRERLRPKSEQAPRRNALEG